MNLYSALKQSVPPSFAPTLLVMEVCEKPFSDRDFEQKYPSKKCADEEYAYSLTSTVKSRLLAIKLLADVTNSELSLPAIRSQGDDRLVRKNICEE